MYIYIYMYMYIHINEPGRPCPPLQPYQHLLPRGHCRRLIRRPTASLRAKILDFRGFDSIRILKFKGWNSHAHREVPGKLGSSNLSRERFLVGRLGQGGIETGRRRPGFVKKPAVLRTGQGRPDSADSS